MRAFGYIIYIFLLLTLTNQKIKGQTVSIEAQKIYEKITDQIGETYKSSINYPQKKIKKEFWRFSKRFGRYKNLRSHHILEIPPLVKGENTPLLLLVKINGDKQRSEVRIALAMQNFDESAREEYKNLPQNTLREFQIFFYRKALQAQLINLESTLSKLSRQHDRMKKSKRQNKLSIEMINKRIVELLSEKDRIKAEFSEIK